MKIRRKDNQIATTPKLLVFDIGGVLVELGGMSDLVKWTGRSPEEIKDDWLRCEAVREFEAGTTEFDDFAPRVLRDLALPVSVAEFRERMEGWINTPFPDAESIVQRSRKRAIVACLCNLNPVQWPVIRDELRIGDWFQYHFISHETGMVKPDAAAYAHVSKTVGLRPDEIAFFDDSRANVEGARRAGWSAYLVQGTRELALRLNGLGIL